MNCASGTTWKAGLVGALTAQSRARSEVVLLNPRPAGDGALGSSHKISKDRDGGETRFIILLDVFYAPSLKNVTGSSQVMSPGQVTWLDLEKVCDSTMQWLQYLRDQCKLSGYHKPSTAAKKNVYLGMSVLMKLTIGRVNFVTFPL